MAIASIHFWLTSDRNYIAGRLLFEQHSDSSLLKIFFQGGESDYHFNRLVEELKELTSRPEPVAPIISQVVPELSAFPVPSIKHTASDEEWEKFPDSIKDLFAANTQLNNRAQFLFNQISGNNNPDERLVMSLQMLDDRDQININWAAIRDYREKGKIAEAAKEKAVESVSDLTIQKLTAELKNIPTYISKDKAKIAALPDGPKKNKVMLRLQERMAQLEEIKKRIDELV